MFRRQKKKIQFYQWRISALNCDENANNDKDNASVLIFIFFSTNDADECRFSKQIRSVPLFILEDNNGFKRQGIL